MVRIEKIVSRMDFEKRNVLISRATAVTSPGFSRTFVYKNAGANQRRVWMRARAQLPTDDAWRRRRVIAEIPPLFTLGAIDVLAVWDDKPACPVVKLRTTFHFPFSS